MSVILSIAALFILCAYSSKVAGFVVMNVSPACRDVCNCLPSYCGLCFLSMQQLPVLLSEYQGKF